jgi:nitrate reductase gamma subunit
MARPRSGRGETMLCRLITAVPYVSIATFTVGHITRYHYRGCPLITRDTVWCEISIARAMSQILTERCGICDWSHSRRRH